MANFDPRGPDGGRDFNFKFAKLEMAVFTGHVVYILYQGRKNKLTFPGALWL